MDSANVVAAGAALLAAVVSVAVPVWTFRRTLQLESIKWIRDKRAEVYVDILTEAYAEKEWFLNELAALEIVFIDAEFDAGADRRRPAGEASLSGPDLRLSPIERAQLGSRQAIYAGEEVSRSYNEFNVALMQATVFKPRAAHEVAAARMRAEQLFSALETAVRREIGTAGIALPRTQAPPAE